MAKKGSPAQAAEADGDVPLWEEDKFVKSAESIEASLQKQLGSIRAGGAHASMLDNVSLEVYGEQMALGAVAQVAVSGPTQLVVSPFDPSTTEAIAAGIAADADLGLNPSVAGPGQINIPVPKPTAESRQQSAKAAKAAADKAKARLRKLRADVLGKVKKRSKGVSEDEVKDAQKAVQAVVDRFNGSLTKLGEERAKECLG